MARGDYVWIVYDGSGPLGVFTVKSELVSWLPYWEGISIKRLRDGDPHGGRVFLDRYTLEPISTEATP